MKIFIILSVIIVSIQVGMPLKSEAGFRSKLSNVPVPDTVRKPTILIEKTFFKPTQVILIRDTGHITDMSKLFEKDYGLLFHFISKNGLKPGRVMAFYLNYADPLFIDVAVEVDKIPAALPGSIHSKTIDGGEAVVVHFTGPYEQLTTAYNTITSWLKDNKKQAAGLPFEVYLNEPSSVKDTYDLKTDVYQLLKDN